MCPICKHRLTQFESPIKYWGCPECHSVFVMCADGSFGILDKNVKYVNNKEIDKDTALTGGLSSPR